MKFRNAFALLLLALLAGCSTTYIHRDANSATALRVSVGTDQALGELALNDGKGATFTVKRHTSTQSAAAGEAFEGAVRAITRP